MPETTVNIEVLYAALDQKRRTEKISWRSLAGTLQISPSTFTRMAQGLKPDVDTFATLLKWLNMPSENFLHSTTQTKEEPNPIAMISSYLRSSKNLSESQAEALRILSRLHTST